MTNYYEIFNLNSEMPLGEIEEKIKESQRKWQMRTNAPQLSKRQEAENMIKLIAEAKKILTDKKSKEKYDKNLRKSSTKKTNKKKAPINTSGLDYNQVMKKANDLISKNQLTEAFIIIKKLVLEYPKKPEIQSLYGYCLYRLGRMNEAIQAYETSLAYDSKNLSTYYDLIYIQIDLKKINLAEQYLQTALRLADNPEPFKKLQVYILSKKGQYNEVINIVEDQLENNESVDNEIIYELCNAYERKALEFHQKASNGYYYLVDETNIEIVLEYWEKIKKYKHVYKNKNYPDDKYNEIKNLMNKKFFKPAWKLFILPVIILFITIMSSSDMSVSSRNTMLLISFLGAGVSFYFAYVPQFKINMARLSGKKLPVERLITVNGWLWKIATAIWIFMWAFVGSSAKVGSDNRY